MRRGELSNGDIGGGLVGLEGFVGGVLSLVTSGKLGKVSVVVSHPINTSADTRSPPVEETYILW